MSSNATAMRIKPERKRDEYLSRVESLYSQVRRWVSEKEPQTVFSEETIEITEDLIGTYTAKVLVIKCPDRRELKLIPSGCWIVGAEGGLYLRGSLGTETLMYVAEGGPHYSINQLTESGLVLTKPEPRPFFKRVKKGWVYLQNRHLDLLPKVDANLFLRLIEAMT